MSSEAWFSAFHCEDVGQAEFVQKYYKVISFQNLVFVYMLWGRFGMLWVKCIFSGLWILYLSYIAVWNIIQWPCSAGLVSGTVAASLEAQVKEWLKTFKSSWFSQKFYILPASVDVQAGICAAWWISIGSCRNVCSNACLRCFYQSSGCVDF